jgi:ribosomal-protein-alanine N-acetyltransferase
VRHVAAGLPVLSDGRVLLRPSEPRDLPAIDAGQADPDVLRWIGPPHGTAREALIENEQRWATGSPTLSICDPDGTCLGLIWINVREPDRSTGFVGYWLLPVGRGRGFATSAVRLISSWAIRELRLKHLRLRTAPDNLRSQRVAERSGFRRVIPRSPEDRGAPEDDQIVFELDASLVRGRRVTFSAAD